MTKTTKYWETLARNILTLMAVTYCSTHCATLSAAEALPNILLTMGDDHGWFETGYNGHPHVKTPVLDEMARTGLQRNRF